MDEGISKSAKKRFQSYWPQFKKSLNYKALNNSKELDLPEDVITVSIQTFLTVMEQSTKAAPENWTEAQIGDGFGSIAAESGPTEDDVTFSVVVAELVGEFLCWLADNGHLKIPVTNIRLMTLVFVMTQLANLPDSPEKKQTLSILKSMNSDHEHDDLDSAYSQIMSEISDNDEAPFDQNLPRWQQHTADNIDHYTSQWVDTFNRNPKYRKRLPKGVTGDDLHDYVGILTDKVYDIWRKTPKSWTKYAVQDVLTDYFVNNVSLPLEKYRKIAPTLMVFMDFVGEEGYLRQPLADRIKRAIDEVADEMVEFAQDEDNYGPAKQFGMALTEAGIDPTDQKAVNAFMSDYNQLQQTQRALDGEPYEESIVHMPDDFYKTLFHVSNYQGHHYNSVTAAKVHHQMITLAWEIWVDDEELRQTQPQALTVDAIVRFGDEMYANYLETPKHWHANFLNNLLTSDKLKKDKALPIVLRKLFIFMNVSGIFNNTQCDELLKVLADNVRKGPRAQSAPSGKVIPLNQWKKQRRRKQRK